LGGVKIIKAAGVNSASVCDGFLIEELLVEAHEKPDNPLVTSMFFVGFLAILLLEEAI
jgi:hypothetical protein